MKSNYKKLGKYIREVNVRDTGKKVNLLLGVSIEKIFKPSIANTIGTDMSTYKIVKKNQFAYGPVTSRNGDKISIALLEDYDEAIVSQAYTPFEIIDTNELLPEYLMMWFRRSEFDRYARFMSHGSAREIFGWEEMCDTELPVPFPDKQREIVKEYSTIVNRIKLNEQLCQKLEETAQALYKHWFVDFEFPDERGMPYKSNGGEMENEIPKGLKIAFLKDFGKVVTGKTPSSENPEHFGNEMPFVTPGDFNGYKKFAIGAERNLSKAGYNFLKGKILKKGSVIVTCIGSDMGKVVIADGDCITNQQMNSIAVNHDFFSDYLYYYLKSISVELKSTAMGGSTMPMLSKSDFEVLSILKPDDRVLKLFHGNIKPLNDHIVTNSKISNAAFQMKDLLLSKLATIEN
jgi:type I restriction enzyme, S subunit